MKIIRAFAVAAIISSLFNSFDSNAQILGIKHYSDDSRMDVGVSLGMPMSYLFKSAIAVDVRYQKDFTSRLAGLVNVGCSYFLGSGAPATQDFAKNAAFFPIKTGAKLFLNQRVYCMAEIGAAFRPTSFAHTSFIYAPAVGYEFNKGLDLSLRYENISKYDVGKIALKVAYGLHYKQHSRYSSWYN